MWPQSLRPNADRVCLVGGSLFLLGFLILSAAVLAQRLDALDLVSRAVVHQSRQPWLEGFMQGASFLGGQPGQVMLAVVGSLALWPHRRRWAVGLPIVMAGVGVAQLVAKWAVDRPRPNLHAWGFPSAHVLSLVVLCGYLAYVVSTTSTRRRWRALSVGAGVGVVGTVGYSRMYLDAHWLSDVLGGLTAGLAYLLLAIWAVGVGPRLVSALWARPLASDSGPLLDPAVVAASADPLVVATAAATMTPETPPVSAG
jgi:membrane-associated phospholipid phosphatase